MAFYLGIDGGGSSTRCVVGDELRVLGRAETGSSKVARVGAESARLALQSAIREACSAAQLNPNKISKSCIGIAGASLPEVVESVRAWAAEILAGKIDVVGDMVVAQEAAFAGGGAGVLIIAGTGSICFGRNQQGKTGRAGGGGPIVSDEGSGDWIGRMAAQQASSANASRALTEAIRNAWQLRAATEIAARLNANPPPDFAALFPAVLSAATDGDQAARGILNSAGGELAKLAAALIRQLWSQPQRVRLAISGGVLQNSAVVRQTLVTRLRADLEQAGYEIAVSFGQAEPVMGALSLARRMPTGSAKGNTD
jgi:N-acetylglucosamine kinase-like BadF-type ATPase